MTVQTIYPTASSHDAWQDGAAVVTLTGEVKSTAGTQWIGLLLAAVAAAAADTINAATLNYMALNTTHDDPALNWYAQAADSAGVFTTGASDISGRTRGTALVGDTATGIGNTIYRQVNIKPLIEEVLARLGWVAGGNIALIGDAQSACDLWIPSYDANSGSNLWYVTIDYTAAGGGLPVKAIYYARMMGG